jgi:Tripartite tricarboxylate transporter family receptor
MKLPRRRFLHLAAGAAALPVLSPIARAQTYPSRPITMVAPFPAGGSTDAVGRIVAERMRVSLGQAVVIENVGGAGGSIGVGRVARATPDGYTLDIGQWDTHVANGATFALAYDVVKDFEPIALLSSNPFLILAKKAVPAGDLKGLVAWVEGQSRQGVTGNPYCRIACRRPPVPERNGDALCLCPISRWRSCDAGPRGRADRPDDHSGGRRPAATACRRHQGLRRHRQQPLSRGSRNPERR